MDKILDSIPIVFNQNLPPNCLMIIGKGTPNVRIETDCMDTIRDAFDEDFLKKCGIVKGINA